MLARKDPESYGRLESRVKQPDPFFRPAESSGRKISEIAPSTPFVRRIEDYSPTRNRQNHSEHPITYSFQPTVDRLIAEIGGQPALDLLHTQAATPGVILHLIFCHPVHAEVAGLRMGEVETTHRSGRPHCQ